jgi:membrane protease YdiL (CAAX protease family)
VPRSALWAVLVLRTALAAAVAAAAIAVAAVIGSSSPVRSAAAAWPVTATLVDIGCLVAIAALARRESVGLRDLLNFGGLRDLRWLPLVILLIGVGVAASSFLTSLTYPAGSPPEITVVDLPPWAAIYAVIVWPAIWAFTEELTYLGYALPRLEAVSGRALAVILVIAFWSLQHLALPFLADATYLVHRGITPLPVVAMTTLSYFVVGRRLLPLIVVHWLGDTLTAYLAVSAMP